MLSLLGDSVYIFQSNPKENVCFFSLNVLIKDSMTKIKLPNFLSKFSNIFGYDNAPNVIVLHKLLIPNVTLK